MMVCVEKLIIHSVVPMLQISSIVSGKRNFFLIQVCVSGIKVFIFFLSIFS